MTETNYPPLESNRLRQVQSPIIPVIGELIQAHPGTISLGQGVVYYGPPPETFSALAAFGSQPDHHRYKPVQGIPPLLDALTEKLKTENNLAVDASRSLLVTAGGNLAFMNAILAVTDPGDEVLLPTPYYFNHEMAIVMANARPVLVPTDAQHQLNLSRLEQAITPRTRAIVTVSPNNPTGAVYPESSLREVNDLCRRRGLFHISDEAYEYFVYETPQLDGSTRSARHFSPGSIPGSAPHTLSLYSLSKAYGYASWRVGYMVFPQSLENAIKKIQDTLLICAPVISQFGAIGALQAGRAYCLSHLREIAQTRALVRQHLQTLADECFLPDADGAFYFFVRVRTSLPARAVAERLIREHGVAVIPGCAFGASSGCSLRLAYGALQEHAAQPALERFVQGIRAVVAAHPAEA